MWSRVSPDVVTSAEDHAALAVAGGPDLAQLGLAAGALQAARVPVPLHGEEQEAVGYSAPAARARPGGRPTTRHLAVHHGGAVESITGAITAKPHNPSHVAFFCLFITSR